MASLLDIRLLPIPGFVGKYWRVARRLGVTTQSVIAQQYLIELGATNLNLLQFETIISAPLDGMTQINYLNVTSTPDGGVLLLVLATNNAVLMVEMPGAPPTLLSLATSNGVPILIKIDPLTGAVQFAHSVPGVVASFIGIQGSVTLFDNSLATTQTLLTHLYDGTST